MSSGTFTIDGRAVPFAGGQTVMDAALEAGVYIPHLCHRPGYAPHGSCKLCTVAIGGRNAAACSTAARDGMVIENESPALVAMRRELVEMLFVEGNHYCMFCEKSGNCELQAMAYRLGILAMRHPYMFPVRKLDASHPDVMVELNRCILCARCIRASQELDGKHVFDFVGRGSHRHIGVNAAAGAGGTNLKVIDKAAEACPVGSIVKKRVGFAVPIGQRLYDTKPIGSAIEAGRAAKG